MHGVMRDIRDAAFSWARASYLGFCVSAYAWWAPIWLRLLFVLLIGGIVALAVHS